MSVELVIAIVVVLVLVSLGVWRLVAAWGGQKAGGAVARDDLGEMAAKLEATGKAADILAQHPSEDEFLKQRRERLDKLKRLKGKR